MDYSELHYVKRIVVGNDDPSKVCTPKEIEASVALLNRCLSDSPKGRILGIDKGFTIVQAAEAQVVMQWCSYHVAFPRKPHWLNELERGENR